MSSLPSASTTAALILVPASVPLIIAKVSAMSVDLHARRIVIELQHMGCITACSALIMSG
eukprot:5994213-Karenia_brevis.AAC.1